MPEFCSLRCSVAPAVHGGARSRSLCVHGARGKRAQGEEIPMVRGIAASVQITFLKNDPTLFAKKKSTFFLFIKLFSLP